MAGAPWGYVGAAYAKMLSVVYPAIKAADPQAQVLLGGIAYDWYKDQPSPFFAGFHDDAHAENITVAWLDPVQSDERIMLALAAQEATVRDIVGQATVVLDADDGSHDGQVSVSVTGRAVYITTSR